MEEKFNHIDSLVKLNEQNVNVLKATHEQIVSDRVQSVRFRIEQLEEMYAVLHKKVLG